jgi:predicted HicB family RNase H-like nuclease
MSSDRDTQIVHVRLPSSLHTQVKWVADDEGATLNAFLIA